MKKGLCNSYRYQIVKEQIETAITRPASRSAVSHCIVLSTTVNKGLEDFFFPRTNPHFSLYLAQSGVYYGECVSLSSVVILRDAHRLEKGGGRLFFGSAASPSSVTSFF